MNPDVYRVRVCAAVLRPGDELLVVRQSRLGLPRFDLPGGIPELGESLEAALVREVREETGYDVAPAEIAYVAEWRAERFSDATLEVCFYAHTVGRTTAPKRQGENILSVEWIGVHDPALLRDVPHAELFASNKRGRYIVETRPSLREART